VTSQPPGAPGMSQPEPEPEPLVAVYLTVAVRTSRGPGPGPLELPAAEAGRLITARFAIGGSQPPRGMGDATETAVREFR
jgi:hypothetical protein